MSGQNVWGIALACSSAENHLEDLRHACQEKHPCPYTTAASTTPAGWCQQTWYSVPRLGLLRVIAAGVVGAVIRCQPCAGCDEVRTDIKQTHVRIETTCHLVLLWPGSLNATARPRRDNDEQAEYGAGSARSVRRRHSAACPARSLSRKTRRSSFSKRLCATRDDSVDPVHKNGFHKVHTVKLAAGATTRSTWSARSSMLTSVWRTTRANG